MAFTWDSEENQVALLGWWNNISDFFDSQKGRRYLWILRVLQVVRFVDTYLGVGKYGWDICGIKEEDVSMIVLKQNSSSHWVHSHTKVFHSSPRFHAFSNLKIPKNYP